MDAISFKTISANEQTIKKQWLILDAENQVLGRLSSEAARLLRGKHKPDFTPHVDSGDYLIVINAEKIRLTGKKWTDKKYISYTGYPGGQRITNPKELITRKPTALVEKAIKGMLPKNKMGSVLRRNLYVYAGAEHPHSAQQPKEIKL